MQDTRDTHQPQEKQTCSKKYCTMVEKNDVVTLPENNNSCYFSQRQVPKLMEARIKGRLNEVITGGWESLLMGMGFQTEGVPPKFTTLFYLPFRWGEI
ncbi:hypothetical protein CEXT_267901 [Caerostris extrusa]|uniref:Uncharacterized protein n=1 Tax=Caerostris extrusa TaxID=172846 RepID=A0AAV4TKQ7_CAEEX|nr:hypothetical protein CEXT_267901 [Caerostris extrusa]